MVGAAEAEVSRAASKLLLSPIGLYTIIILVVIHLTN